MNFIKLIQSDFKKYKKYSGNFIVIVFFTQGFWAIFQYRFAHFVYLKVKCLFVVVRMFGGLKKQNLKIGLNGMQ